MDLTFNITEDVPDGKYYTRSVVTAVCLIVISVFAVGGNLLVLAAIFINRNLRSISDLFLANLAVADFFQAALAIPFRAAVLLEIQKQEPPVPCLVVVFFSILFGGASNINILLVSADRFIAIKWPFKYHSCVTMKVFVSSIVLSWLLMFLFAVSPLVGWGRSENPSSSPTCRFTMTLDRTYVAIGYIFIHGFPLVTIIILYLFILKASFRHSRAIAAQEFSLRTNISQPTENLITREELSTNGEQSREIHSSGHSNFLRARNHVLKTNRASKGARMIAVLVGVFIILVLPIIVIDVVEMWEEPFAPPIVVNIAICLIYANSGVNVFIYAGWNTEYRRAFHRVLVTLWKLATNPCS